MKALGEPHTLAHTLGRGEQHSGMGGAAVMAGLLITHALWGEGRKHFDFLDDLKIPLKHKNFSVFRAKMLQKNASQCSPIVHSFLVTPVTGVTVVL